MHTAIIIRMSRYTRWFRLYKVAKSYTALQELADKIESDWYLDKTTAKAIRPTRIINYELELFGLVNIQNKWGKTALHYAACKNAVESVKVLLTRPEIEVNIQDNIGWTALHKAARFNAVESLKVLLTRPGIEVNIQNKFGYTALHYTALYHAVEALKVLLTRPEIEVNKQDKGGATALYIAAEGDNDKTVKELLARDDILVDRMTEQAIRMYMGRQDRRLK